MTNSGSLSSSEYASNGGNHEDRSILCHCCCYEIPLENMVQCANGHLFCFRCVLRQVQEILFGSLEARGCLPCMDTDDCNESIPLCEIRRALPNDVFKRYEERLGQRAVIQVIIEAGLENLVYCPFCSTPYEVDECVQVLDCPNPECLKASCIQCKEPSHLPLRCEEVEKLSETAVRRKVEERMTKAVIRQCNTCKAELVKTNDGCNKLTCTMCGSTMCYVCRQTISSGYHHFCDHYTRAPGKPCLLCDDKKCDLWETEVEDNVALDAKEEALKELEDEKLNLIDQEIGPTLARQAQEVLPNQLLPEQHRDSMEDQEIGPPLARKAQVLPNQLLPEQHRDFIEEFNHLNPVLQQLVANQLAKKGIPPELLEEFSDLNSELQQLVSDELANIGIPAEIIKKWYKI